MIEALWDTIPDEAMPQISDEWLAEIQRRSAEYDAGKVQAIPWEQVRADALRRARPSVATSSPQQIIQRAQAQTD